MTQVEPVLEELTLPLKTSAGNGRLTLRRAWIENYRYAKFLIVGGIKRLVLDGLTLYIPHSVSINSSSPLEQQKQDAHARASNCSSIGDFLISSATGNRKNISFAEVKIRRIEFVWLSEDNEVPFLRASGAVVNLNGEKKVELVNAWYRENAREKWQKLSSAVLGVDEITQNMFLRIHDSSGKVRTIDLRLTLFESTDIP